MYSFAFLVGHLQGARSELRNSTRFIRNLSLGKVNFIKPKQIKSLFRASETGHKKIKEVTPRHENDKEYFFPVGILRLLIQ